MTRLSLPLRGSSLSLGGEVPLICTPLVATSRIALMAEADSLQRLDPPPDLVEWRADYLSPAPGDVPAILSELQTHLATLPLLFTWRSPLEGGKGHGDEQGRIQVLMNAIEHPSVSLVDCELQATSASDRASVINQARAYGVGVILSFHDFTDLPASEVLDTLIDDMVLAGASACKIALTPATPMDTLRFMEWMNRTATRLPIPLIAMAMGTHGSLSRLAGPWFGSCLTYAVGQQSSAPGQLPASFVRTYWHEAGIRR